jgi:Neuraminidase (sialidase)
MHSIWKSSFAIAAWAAMLGVGQARADGAVVVDKGRMSKRPAIAADGGTLHLAYEGWKKGSKNADIFHTSSADGGKTWSRAADISNTPGISAHPAIAAGKAHDIAVVWSDTTSGEKSPDIFFSRSADGGKTWSKPLDISNTPGISSEPDVAITPDGAVHVIWLDTSGGDANADVWYAGSADGGKTWSKPLDISNTPKPSLTPAIAAGPDGSINVAWCDISSGEASPDVYFSRSSDGGKTWSTPLDVSNTPGVSSDVDIAVDPSGAVYLTWCDAPPGEKVPDIFVSVSNDGGKTWSKPLDVSNTPGVSSDPAIAAGPDGRVAVIWCDTTAGEKSPDVWVNVSTDGGKSFGKPQDLSNTPGISRQPDIAIAQGRLFAVWEEEGAKGVSHVMVTGAPMK